MVLSLTYTAVIRCGLVNIKKSQAGIFWNGWKERWIILKSNFLLVYKNTKAQDFLFRLSLQSIKDIDIKDASADRTRCLQLTMQEGIQYYLSFHSENEFQGWHDDIYRMSPLALVLVVYEEGEVEEIEVEEIEVEEIIDGYLDDYASTSSVRAAMPEPSTSNAHPSLARRIHNPSQMRISSTPNLLDSDTGQSAHGTLTSWSTAAQTYGLNAHDRELLRKAISFLCSCMEPRLLRRSDPGGEKPFDLVEIRLRALLRVKKKWTKQYDPRDDYETILAFSEALKDGYVLCQTLNTIGSSPMLRPNDRDNVNVSKFLSFCRDMGIPREELFFPGDLTAVTPESSVKVARTILTLAELAKTSSEDRATTAESLLKFSKSTDVLLRPPAPSISVSSDEFIAIRIKKKSLRYDQTQPTLKVYQNVASLLMDEQAVWSLQDKGLEDTLIKLVNFMASLDTVSSLVESRQFRIRLLQYSATIHSYDYQLLREALKKDDIEIAKLLRTVVYSDEYKQVVAGLQGQDAQDCVDLIQDVLDRRSLRAEPGSDVFYYDAQRLLVKFSECTDSIPTSLFIKGVDRQDPHACTGGTFADIYRATYRDQDVALKRIRIFQGDVVGKHKAQRRFCREALLWQRLHHPFVLPFWGIDSESFPSYLCMVSPWMRHGTILKHLDEHGHINVEQKLFEIAQGLTYLHSQHIVHGDLRGSNILVNDEWRPCLADFGLAVFEDATMATPSQQGGSVRWMAPELHHPQAFKLDHFRRTFASDVYSFACVCIELFTGKPPFSDIPYDPAVMLRVMAGERPDRPIDPFGRPMPDRLWGIVELCWSHDPGERPTMSIVVERMKEVNGELQETDTTLPTETLDWDISLHSPSGSKLVRRRKMGGSRSAAVRRPFNREHRSSRSG